VYRRAEHVVDRKEDYSLHPRQQKPLGQNKILKTSEKRNLTKDRSEERKREREVGNKEN
jgi:hypothetical protein